jgi:hypothetical protein
LSLFILENRTGHVEKEGLDFLFFASEKQVEIVCFRTGPQTISNCCSKKTFKIVRVSVIVEGGNAFAERPAQGTGETPHGSVCVSEIHCSEAQE